MKEKLNKVFDAIKDAVGEVSGKAEIAKELVKLNYSRSKTEQNIKDAYAELGKVLFESGVVPECDSADEMDCLCEEIDTYLEDLKNIKDSINMIKGKVECSECGKICSENYQFCPVCGNELSFSNDEEYCCDCEECSDEENCCECEENATEETEKV